MSTYLDQSLTSQCVCTGVSGTIIDGLDVSRIVLERVLERYPDLKFLIAVF